MTRSMRPAMSFSGDFSAVAKSLASSALPDSKRGFCKTKQPGTFKLVRQALCEPRHVA